MKKLVGTLCVIGSAIALSACTTDGAGHEDTQPPYADERTAGGETDAPVRAAPARAERTFSRAQSK